MLNCLNCGRIFPRTIGGNGAHPDGFMVCLECKHVMAFADDLSLRPLTMEELIEAQNDIRIPRHVVNRWIVPTLFCIFVLIAVAWRLIH